MCNVLRLVRVDCSTSSELCVVLCVYMFNLPKGYLSSSACDLWESNPQEYREKYYLNRPGFSTPYTTFGKDFAFDIEKNPEKYPHIPKGSVSEFPVKWVIGGVPVVGFLDSFEPTTKSIFEYKTSVNSTWNQVKVRKWKQLPFYAMCVHEMFGTYDPVVKLIVMETEWGEECKETRFGTKVILECDKALKFKPGTLDNPIVFEREIELWEVEKMKERLVAIATAISEDYTSYQQGGVDLSV